MKLEQKDERDLRMHLKVFEDSEVLYRIFKLFNLFYDKFSAELEKQKDDMQINTDSSKPSDAVQFVKRTYENEALQLFI